MFLRFTLHVSRFTSPLRFTLHEFSDGVLDARKGAILENAMHATEPPRCHHCGREVEETKHTRSSYRVGYYELHGGEVEEVTQVRPDEEGGSVTFLRLLEPRSFYTCTDCYRLRAVSEERELLLRPELGVAGNR